MANDNERQISVEALDEIWFFVVAFLKCRLLLKLQPIIKLSYQGYKGQTSIGLFEQSQPARYGYCCEYRD